jgi:hypothetical protein
MVQETVTMKYGYIVYGNRSVDTMDKLPADMDRFKEHAETHGFHMKYWGHPYGVSESIVVVFKSENDLGAYQKMVFAYSEMPYIGDRTILAARA